MCTNVIKISYDVRKESGNKLRSFLTPFAYGVFNRKSLIGKNINEDLTIIFKMQLIESLKPMTWDLSKQKSVYLEIKSFDFSVNLVKEESLN